MPRGFLEGEYFGFRSAPKFSHARSQGLPSSGCPDASDESEDIGAICLMDGAYKNTKSNVVQLYQPRAFSLNDASFAHCRPVRLV